MKEYDIIVVGAGSAGSSAAKTAAEKGAKVILLEEHPQIGIPRHCTGILYSSAYRQEILEMVGEDIIIQLPEGMTKQADPSIRREEFDQKWAMFAATAGAEIVVNTRVTGLLKEDGKIIGVTTSSRAMPEVRGKLVIAAGGYTAERSGIPAQEGLSMPDEEWFNGVQLQLTNIKDLGSSVEHYSTSLFYRGYCGAGAPINGNSSWAPFHSLEEFERIKAADHPLSYHLRDAQIVQMIGYVVPLYWSLTMPKTVRDGLILVGSAAGFNGMIPAVMTGRYAGQVAAEAIEAGDVTEAKLKKYEEMYKDEGWDRMYESAVICRRKLRELVVSQASDEEIYRAAKEMSEQGMMEVYRP